MEFEQAFATYCGAAYAIAVAHGTSALTIANQAAGLQPGQQVLTTTNSFVATANSVELCGGQAQLVDINPLDFNISPPLLADALVRSEKAVGILPVHFAGVPADMEAIAALAQAHDLYVIEDACHALGGTWSDAQGVIHRVGDCSHSDLTIFSFHPVKQITTGEGGMVTTNDPAIYAKLLALRSHGITKPVDTARYQAQPWLYEMHLLSANHRITDIQCALGRSQLSKADEWIMQRTRLVQRYDQSFLEDEFITPQQHPVSGAPSYHLYVVKARDRDALYRHLHQQGILVQVHYIPIHFQPYYQRKYGYQSGDFPICEDFYQQALSLPLYPGLTDQEQDRVIDQIRGFYHGR